MDQVEELTERELEVEQLIYLGLSNAEIADKCGIVEGTVKTHVQAIYRKRLIDSRLKLMATEIAKLRSQLALLKKRLKRSPHTDEDDEE